MDGLVAENNAIAAAITALNGDLETADRALTMIVKIPVVPQRTPLPAGKIEVPPGIFAPWLDSTDPKDVDRVVPSLRYETTAMTDGAQVDPAEQTYPYEGSGNGNGVFVRDPAILVIKLIAVLPNNPEWVHARASQEVFQAGRLRLIPITNGIFQSNSIGLTMDDSGRLIAMEYKSSSARAKAIADTVGGIIDTIVSSNTKYWQQKTAEANAEADYYAAKEKARKAKLDAGE